MTEKKGFFRTPKNYQGTRPTGKTLSEVMPYVMDAIHGACEEKPDLIMQAWPKIIGDKLAPMTKAVSFERHVLHVTVNNSSLLSLLSRYEKYKLLTSLKEMFPSIEIRDIRFRIG